MSTLTEVSSATINPLVHIWNNIISYLPGFVGAIIVSLVGYLIALIIGNLIKHSLAKAKLDSWVDKKGFSKILLNLKMSVLIGQLVKWGIFISFLAPAANLIKLDALSMLIRSFAMWVPNLILAIIVLAIGAVLAESIARAIHHRYHKGAQLFSDVVRVIIIVIFADIALNQIGVQIQFVEALFLVIVGAILLVAAIVVGIGFGNAIKGHAQEMVDNYLEKKSKAKSKAKK